MEQFLLLWSMPLYQHIFIMAILGSLLAALASFIMGYNQFSGIAGSLAHMILGGVGIAGFFKFSPFIGSIFIVIIGSLILTSVKLKSPQNLELVGNVLWGVGMALGVLFLSITKGYQQGLNSFLFGNILLISSTDIVQSIILNAISILFIVIFYRQLMVIMFNPHLARVQNLPIFFLYFILILIIAFSILTLVKTVGIVLALILLSVPFYTVRLFTNKVFWVLFGSFSFSLLSILLGLYISYEWNVPTSSVIVLSSLGLFGVLKWIKVMCDKVKNH